eukprot:TRINITY_DN11394_c0_g1_i1.p1 TRINITY_DN11394_c0_g1~~TRINITY_DN11394_c0_g1_i1.p1  ORF type:complete len:726 (+),score=109.02 TRINITY_DN11394_c0_g1_i1:73-2250(+)
MDSFQQFLRSALFESHEIVQIVGVLLMPHFGLNGLSPIPWINTFLNKRVAREEDIASRRSLPSFKTFPIMPHHSLESNILYLFLIGDEVENEPTLAKCVAFFFTSCHSVLIPQMPPRIDISLLRLLRTALAIKHAVLLSSQSTSTSSKALQRHRNSNQSRGSASTAYEIGKFIPTIHFMGDQHSFFLANKDLQNAASLDKMRHSLFQKFSSLSKAFELSLSGPNKSLTKSFLYVLDQLHSIVLPEQHNFANGSYEPNYSSLKSSIVKTFTVFSEKISKKSDILLPLHAWSVAVESVFASFGLDASAAAGALFEHRLPSCLHPSLIYSKESLESALQRAQGVYNQDLPPEYSKATHLIKFKQSIHAFKTTVQAFPYESYEALLAEYLQEAWSRCVQLCSASSLTGHRCIKHAHNDDHEKYQLQEESYDHESNHTVSLSCNCGATVEAIKDPFNIMELKALYFHRSCCLKYRTVKQYYSNNQPLVVMQLGPYDTMLGTNGFRGQGLISDKNRPISWTISNVTSAKSSDWDKGRGNSHRETHRQDHMGLQEDMSVYNRQAFFSPDKSQSKRRDEAQALYSTKDSRQSTTYVGYEYECPQGHRHLNIPRKSQQVSSLCLPAETLHVYRACPSCHEKHREKSAQLLRLCISIPKSERSISCKPKINWTMDGKPGMHPEVKMPFECGDEIILTPGYTYSIRLPFIYFSEETPISRNEGLLELAEGSAFFVK